MATRATSRDEQPIRPSDLVSLGLTLRQAEVLSWLAFGKTDAEIGAILGITGKTVSHTVGRIYQKLDVGSRVQATTRALGIAGRRR